MDFLYLQLNITETIWNKFVKKFYFNNQLVKKEFLNGTFLWVFLFF